MHPLISRADVKMYGSIDPDGELYKDCRVTMIGNPADAVLYGRVGDGSRWLPVDRLTRASVTEQPDGHVTIIGISQELVDVVGMAPEDATVRWEISPKGCQHC